MCIRDRCGDNCSECPRYLAKTEDELKAVAQLWYRVGWRDKIVSNDEIKCFGCSSHKKCTYQLVDCIKEKKIEKCNKCPEFPCAKIEDMLKRSKVYEDRCREICTDEEYQKLKVSFFEKENNLKK